jgi:hypothetical protein
MQCAFLSGSEIWLCYVATQLSVTAYEYLIWGYPCWKTVFELLYSTTIRGTMKDYWLTMQQLLTAFYGNKFNEKF